MQIKFTYAQKTVYEMLATREVNDISVVHLCRTLKCSRHAFYKRFDNKNNFLTLCLIQNIHDEMKKHKKRGVNESVYYLLRHLQNDRMYYENMGRLLKRTCICTLLKDKLHEMIWNKMKLDDEVARVLVKEMTDIIYVHLFFWLKHHCDKDMRKVYHQVESVLNRLNHMSTNTAFIEKLRLENYHYLWGHKEFED